MTSLRSPVGSAFYVPHGDEGRAWFISDPHFDHANIIRYCNRPFDNVDSMNDAILRNWNSCVRPSDLVFFLGDMAFGRGSRTPRWWLGRLAGRKVYVKGSHDHGVRPTSRLDDSVVTVLDFAVLVTDSTHLLLVHDPFDIPYWWTGWIVHGHVHNNGPHVDNRFGRSRVNVSVEVIDYKPITVRSVLMAVSKGGQ